MMPAADDFDRRTRDSFDRQPAMRTLGASLQSVVPGQVVITMTHQAALTQQHGFLHAGMIATALDSACGYAAFTLMPADAAVLTIEFKVNLLAPARGPLFRIDGRVVKPGRTITVVEGHAWQHAPDSDANKLVATMTATIMTVTGRDGLQH
ncbi:MAG: PaaI family thioesterase [Rhizobacter sp.]|nr:PaaI family thioesterase [Rhizobacter sp.]